MLSIDINSSSRKMSKFSCREFTQKSTFIWRRRTLCISEECLAIPKGFLFWYNEGNRVSHSVHFSWDQYYLRKSSNLLKVEVCNSRRLLVLERLSRSENSSRSRWMSIHGRFLLMLQLQEILLQFDCLLLHGRV